MDQAKFIRWKYRHDGAGYRHPYQRWVAAVLLLLAIGLGKIFDPVFGVFLAAIGLTIGVVSQKFLFLGNRYLICGERIVYYANVRKINVQGNEGIITLHLQQGKTFRLERERCTTNARKPAKIAQNQANKFAKIIAALVRRVRFYHPELEVIGFDVFGLEEKA